MPSDITFEATYRHPPELVWRLLSSSEALDRWLMKNTFGEAKAGATFRFEDRPRPFWDGLCDCEIVTAEAPRKLELKWGVNQPPGTTVTWTLTPTADGGTRVDFRHAGLQGVMGWFMKLGMSKGWQQMLTRSWPFMLDRLAAGQPLPSRDEVKKVQRNAS